MFVTRTINSAMFSQSTVEKAWPSLGQEGGFPELAKVGEFSEK
jgi:hypothetical protein